MKTKDPYTRQLKAFLDMMQGRLNYAFEEQDKGNYEPMEQLYNQSFTLSFMGKTCELYFGAFEYQEIEQMLQNIIEENNL